MGDLTQFDPKSTQFHLIVAATQVFNGPISQPTSMIARAIHLTACFEWILNKSFIGQSFPI